MRPHEPHDEGDQGRSPRRRDYSLFYFQHDERSGRSHLRFTLLGVIVFALLIVIPVTALFILFFINSRTPMPEANINVSGAPSSPSATNVPVIQSLPQPPQPTPLRTPRMPPRPTLQVLNNNAPEPLPPGRTPRPTPSSSPP